MLWSVRLHDPRAFLFLSLTFCWNVLEREVYSVIFSILTTQITIKRRFELIFLEKFHFYYRISQTWLAENQKNHHQHFLKKPKTVWFITILFNICRKIVINFPLFPLHCVMLKTLLQIALENALNDSQISIKTPYLDSSIFF